MVVYDMKRFNVTVNGKTYDVAVEEVDGSAPITAAPVASAPAVQPAPAPAVAPAEPAKEAVPVASAEIGEGTVINAPMPGTILDIKVSIGDVVKRGQAVVVLEAMKMENDIVATCDGKITSILVNKGDTVNSSDPLVTIQ
jgi:biotin carboxyl carrier protein